MSNSKSQLRKTYRAISARLQNSFDANQLEELKRKISRLVSAYPGVWGGYREIQGEPALALTQWKGPGEWLFPKVKDDLLDYYRPNLRSDKGQWIRSGLGIWELSDDCEQVPLEQLQGVILPGLAFDSLGTRLGYGKGFYDKTLSEFKGLIVGVAWDEQISETSLPFEKHDVRCQIILTPTRFLDLRSKV